MTNFTTNEQRERELRAADEMLEQAERSLEASRRLAEKMRLLQASQKSPVSPKTQTTDIEPSTLTCQKENDAGASITNAELVDELTCLNASLSRRIRELEERNSILSDALFLQQRENHYLRHAISQMTLDELRRYNPSNGRD